MRRCFCAFLPLFCISRSRFQANAGLVYQWVEQIQLVSAYSVLAGAAWRFDP